MTNDELVAFIAEQRAIDAARTPGEWLREDWNDGTKGFRTISGTTFMWIDESGTMEDDNTPFITAASANYGKLLDIIEAQQKRIIELEHFQP